MSDLTLWQESTDTLDYEPPAHIDRSKCGANLTNYTKGCRCEMCRQAKAENKRRWVLGVRVCQHCDQEYARAGKGSGGTKFCARCISEGVYWRNAPGRGAPKEVDGSCARCGQAFHKKSSRRYDLCTECTQHPVFRVMMASLGKHKVPVGIVIAVLDWPYCANEQCGAWLLEQAQRKRSREHSGSKFLYNFAVDHDHRCCSGQDSCGQCIRGIICRDCNMAMPHRLDAFKAQGIADYLRAHG